MREAKTKYNEIKHEVVTTLWLREIFKITKIKQNKNDNCREVKF